MKELRIIQSELSVPKNQLNEFGNYNYRSAEDILEAVKKLLEKTECTLTITDKIVNIGQRYYVKATATIAKEDLKDGSSDCFVSVSAYAREAQIKKGMDEAQITGSASSYARKYALNGLFAIDDTKGPDSRDNREKETTKKTTKKSTKEVLATDKQIHLMKSLMKENAGITTPEEYKDYLGEMKLEDGKITKSQAHVIIEKLKK